MAPLKNTCLSRQDRSDFSPLLSDLPDFSPRPTMARIKKQPLDSINEEELLDHEELEGEEQEEKLQSPHRSPSNSFQDLYEEDPLGRRRHSEWRDCSKSRNHPEREERSGMRNLADVLVRLASRESSFSSSKVRKPDPFDGSNSRKLWTFLLQLNLVFCSSPQTYASDRNKVTYVLLYLKSTALEWFEPGLLNHLNEPNWVSDFFEFEDELKTNFGVYDLVDDAEARLETLTMQDDKPCAVYLSEFQKLAAQVRWSDGALHHRLYSGLLTRLKDKVSKAGKPETLAGMCKMIQTFDHHHWERQEEIYRERKFQAPKSLTPGSTFKGSNNSRNEGAFSSNSSN